MNAFSYLFPHGKSFSFELLKSFVPKANGSRPVIGAKLRLMRQAARKAGSALCAFCLPNDLATASSNSTHH